MGYRTLLVDDEPLARERLARLLEAHPQFELAAALDSGDAMLEWLQQHSAELVLLDIQMPGRTGLEVAAELTSMAQPPLVVFCTAYDEHALEAFGVDAIDYLLKPIRRDDLSRALGRAEQRLALRQPATERASGLTQEPAADASGTDARSHLSARTHNGLELIPIDDVLYFSADQKYVNAVHEQGQTLIDDSLKQLEEEFGERFVRVHRSALVARDRMTRLEAQTGGGHRLYLRGQEEGISVSRRHLADVRRLMKRL